MEAAEEYLEKQLNNSEWKKIVMDGFVLCNDETTENLKEIQRRSNFTEEQCNVKYTATLDCLGIAMFAVTLDL